MNAPQLSASASGGLDVLLNSAISQVVKETEAQNRSLEIWDECLSLEDVLFEQIIILLVASGMTDHVTASA